MPRMYKRLTVSFPAIVAINPTAMDEQILLLRTVDISAAGALFESERSPSLDSPVKVVFLLGQSDSHQKKVRVVFHGRVVRCAPERFAVSFDEVHPIILSQEGNRS